MKIFSKCSVVFFLLMFFFGNSNSCYGMYEEDDNDNNDKNKEEIIDEKKINEDKDTNKENDINNNIFLKKTTRYLKFFNGEEKLGKETLYGFLFFALTSGIGGHKIWKDNFIYKFKIHVYTADFISIFKFIRIGFSYKISETVCCNIIGFNGWKFLINGIILRILTKKEKNRNKKLFLKYIFECTDFLSLDINILQKYSIRIDLNCLILRFFLS